MLAKLIERIFGAGASAVGTLAGVGDFLGSRITGRRSGTMPPEPPAGERLPEPRAPEQPVSRPPVVSERPGQRAVTEPTTTSRAAAHGGSSYDADVEGWRDELDDGVDVVTSAGTTGAEIPVNPDTGLPNRPQ